MADRIPLGALLAACAAAAGALVPAEARACGGLFCNANQPVNQSAERILFARDGDTVHMHVRITYAGPPAAFGWLLPVPPGVETTLSSEALFTQLDQLFGPRFVLQTEFVGDCAFANRAGSDGESGFADGGAGPPGVQVLSREAIGPFDRAILQAPDVVTLRAWLDENEYQIPESTDARLQPYIDAGAVFVAVKLLPGAGTGDIQPLTLSFPADLPSIPIQPTGVAATPDMGVIVHVLGDRRAIPRNYRHVIINEAAIDWLGGGQNYPDVVSQAADEAQGRAFVTDYAGPATALDGTLPVVDARVLARIAAARTAGELYEAASSGFAIDADLARTLAGAIDVPEGQDPVQYFSCPDCFGQFDRQAPVDGAAVAARIRSEVNPAREHIADLLTRHPYLTRLYTTLSAEEMTEDPVFSFNRDLPEVANVRTAIRRIACDENGAPRFEDTVIITESGLHVPVVDGANPDAIRRQDGRTVRGQGVTAAAVIERLLEDGAPAVETDHRGDLADRYPARGTPSASSDAGCDCSIGAGGRPEAALVFLGLLALLRRRRRA